MTAAVDDAEDVDRLAAALSRPSLGEELVLRDDLAFASKVVRIPVRNDEARKIRHPASAAASRNVLCVQDTGSIDSVVLSEARSTAPAPRQVEIEVDFAALNFKDVMKPLGLLTTEDTANTWIGTELGLEGSGRITRLVIVSPGLVRDTRESLINPSPWNEADDPALYYYLLDLEENWPGAESREPGESDDLIWWRGDPRSGLPAHLFELSEQYGYTSPPPDPAWIDHTQPPHVEPRRSADPSRPLPPETGSRPAM